MNRTEPRLPESRTVMLVGVPFTPTPPPCRDPVTTSWWCEMLTHGARGELKSVVGRLEVPSVRFTRGHHVSLAVIWLRGRPRMIRRLSKRCVVVKKAACPSVILLYCHIMWSRAVLRHQTEAADLRCPGSAQRLCSQPLETGTSLGKTEAAVTRLRNSPNSQIFKFRAAKGQASLLTRGSWRPLKNYTNATLYAPVVTQFPQQTSKGLPC